jgi:secondary thiamine-phosphate synthase enzyme
MEKIKFKTLKREELLDITEEVEKIILEKKVKTGICFVFCPHTTAGLTINENADSSVKSDITNILNKLIPENGNYLHSEGNADSHLKSSLFGSSLNIFIDSGRLSLGTWQGIYFCESDGPRPREVWVKIIKEN